MAVVPNTEAITTGPGATSEAGGGAPDAEIDPATAGPDVAPEPDPPTPPPSGRLPHIRALDGLRGLAVLGVLVYHLELGWLPGGFLGVSLFFTLSGFLITSLVLAERAEHGRVAMGRFWGRRFRRLLPAAWAGIALAVLFAAFAGDADQLRRLPGDVWAALAYAANWRFLFAGDSYAAGYQAPSPILHYWSLAIEEQFYVVFPVVVAALIAWKATRRTWFAVMGVALAGSMACTVIFFDANETSRVYFSSLTRMAEILAGVLLALVLEGWWRHARTDAPPTTTGANADAAAEQAAAVEVAPTVAAARTATAASSTTATVVQPVTRATLERLARGTDDAAVTADPDEVIALGPGDPDVVDHDPAVATSGPTGNGAAARARAGDAPPAAADADASADAEAGPAADASGDAVADGGADAADAADGELPAGSPLLRRSPVPTLADGRPRTLISVATCLALAVVVGLWVRATTADQWVYRGGLWAVAALSCVLVIGAITAGPVAKALAWRPLVFVGAISYGIYVYHWPLFQWLSPERTGLDGIALAIVRVAVTFAVALASYRWLERPIREGRVHLTWATGSAALASVLVVGMVAISLGAQADARAVEIAESAAADTPVITRPAITSPSATIAAATGTTAPPVPIPPPSSVLFIGDSLLHQAFPIIQTHFAELGIETQAKGGPGTSILFDQARWLDELKEALAESKPDVVVIESCCGYDEHREPYTLLGAPLVPDTDETWLVWQNVADQMVDMAADSGALVLWVLAPPAQTTGYYGPIEGRITRANEIALDLPSRHPCVGFVDWRVIAAADGSFTWTLPGLDGQPVTVRAQDGLHFTPPGMNVLAQVSRTAVIDDWEDSPKACVGDRRSP